MITAAITTITVIIIIIIPLARYFIDLITVIMMITAAIITITVTIVIGTIQSWFKKKR
jgi:hypothetical protein